jgi:threonine-phosphate decarboxylase
MNDKQDVSLSRSHLHHDHGGQPNREFTRLSVPNGPVMDFSVNVNPLGFPDIIRRRWADLIEGIDGYPSLEGDSISRFLAKRLGIPRTQVLAGNGSTEMIYLIPRVLELGRVAIVTPSYHDYYRASVLAGAEAVSVSLSAEDQFQAPSHETLANALENADALWLGNPNNPTGTLFPRRLLEETAARFPGKWLIVDEAFMPFLEPRNQESLAGPSRPKNVLVVHSLTKFYGLAGLRLGAVTASENVIKALRDAKEPWTVNSVAQNLVPLLESCAGYEAETRTLVALERPRLFRELDAMEGLDVFPSHANFLLFRPRNETSPDVLIRELLCRGICVRDCRNFPGLESGYFRIAVRTPQENDRLLESMARLFSA